MCVCGACGMSKRGRREGKWAVVYMVYMARGGDGGCGRAGGSVHNVWWQRVDGLSGWTGGPEHNVGQWRRGIGGTAPPTHHLCHPEEDLGMNLLRDVLELFAHLQPEAIGACMRMRMRMCGCVGCVDVLDVWMCWMCGCVGGCLWIHYRLMENGRWRYVRAFVCVRARARACGRVRAGGTECRQPTWLLTCARCKVLLSLGRTGTLLSITGAGNATGRGCVATVVVCVVVWIVCHRIVFVCFW